MPRALFEGGRIPSDPVLLTLLDKRYLVGVTIDLEAELALGVRNLNDPILLQNRSAQQINKTTLRIVRLTSARLAGLGGRRFLNSSLIQIPKICQVTINRYLVGNLLPTSLPEDLSRDDNSLLVAVLVDESVLEISRIHILLFLLESF